MATDPYSSWRDGTTHVALEPREFLEELAALAAPPLFNLIRAPGNARPCCGLESARRAVAPCHRNGRRPGPSGRALAQRPRGPAKLNPKHLVGSRALRKLACCPDTGFGEITLEPPQMARLREGDLPYRDFAGVNGIVNVSTGVALAHRPRIYSR